MTKKTIKLWLKTRRIISGFLTKFGKPIKSKRETHKMILTKYKDFTE